MRGEESGFDSPIDTLLQSVRVKVKKVHGEIIKQAHDLVSVDKHLDHHPRILFICD